jgi:hypothetical protein
MEVNAMELFGWLCLGSFLFAPIVTFAIGYRIGKKGLPYRIVKADQDGGGFEVDV